jgi:hypothetical protein
VFDQLFACAGYAKVLVLEDDMLVASDFFAYFEATATLLDQVRSSSLREACDRGKGAPVGSATPGRMTFNVSCAPVCVQVVGRVAISSSAREAHARTRAKVGV